MMTKFKTVIRVIFLTFNIGEEMLSAKKLIKKIANILLAVGLLLISWSLITATISAHYYSFFYLNTQPFFLILSGILLRITYAAVPECFALLILVTTVLFLQLSLQILFNFDILKNGQLTLLAHHNKAIILYINHILINILVCLAAFLGVIQLKNPLIKTEIKRTKSHYTQMLGIIPVFAPVLATIIFFLILLSPKKEALEQVNLTVKKLYGPSAVFLIDSVRGEKGAFKTNFYFKGIIFKGKSFFSDAFSFIRTVA